MSLVFHTRYLRLANSIIENVYAMYAYKRQQRSPRTPATSSMTPAVDDFTDHSAVLTFELEQNFPLHDILLVLAIILFCRHWV